MPHPNCMEVFFFKYIFIHQIYISLFWVGSLQLALKQKYKNIKTNIKSNINNN